MFTVDKEKARGGHQTIRREENKHQTTDDEVPEIREAEGCLG